jgi:hypothetical protein
MKIIYLVIEKYMSGMAPRITPLKCFTERSNAELYAKDMMQERIDNPRVNKYSGIVASHTSYTFPIIEIELDVGKSIQ